MRYVDTCAALRQVMMVVAQGCPVCRQQTFAYRPGNQGVGALWADLVGEGSVSLGEGAAASDRVAQHHEVDAAYVAGQSAVGELEGSGGDDARDHFLTDPRGRKPQLRARRTRSEVASGSQHPTSRSSWSAIAGGRKPNAPTGLQRDSPPTRFTTGKAETRKAIVAWLCSTPIGPHHHFERTMCQQSGKTTSKNSASLPAIRRTITAR